MKYFVIVLALVALVAAEEEPTNIDHPYYFLHRACAKESGLTPAQEEKIIAFEYPDEDEVHKYILCGATKLGKPGGSTEKAMNDCKKKNEEIRVPQVLAYRVFLCMLDSEVGETMRNGVKGIQTKPAAADS